MIKTIGEFAGCSRDMDGNLLISFSVPDEILASIDKLKGRLSIEAKKYSEKRSLNANGYFWELVDGISRATGNDKWSIYLMLISAYGVWTDIQTTRDALESLKSKFRYVEEFEDSIFLDDEKQEHITARCYFGSSTYNTKEMAYLIQKTEEDANELGVVMRASEEVEALIKNWRKSNGNSTD